MAIAPTDLRVKGRPSLQAGVQSQERARVFRIHYFF